MSGLKELSHAIVFPKLIDKNLSDMTTVLIKCVRNPNGLGGIEMKKLIVVLISCILVFSGCASEPAETPSKQDSGSLSTFLSNQNNR